MFGSQLKKLRNETGLSQAALARELSVSQQTVASWEVDRSSPSPEMLSLIADVFSVSTDYLLERTDQTVVVSNLRLKELRLQHRYTQKELAIKLNIAQNTLCNWENGNRTVDEPTLQKLADFFDVSVDYLLGRTDEKKPAAETGDEPNILLDGFPLTQDEVRLLSQYRALNRQGKEYILQTLDMVVDRYKKDDTVSDVAAPNVG